MFRPTKKMAGNEHMDSTGVWKDVYENGTLISLESRIPMTTAGSILLILQAILPYVLFLPSPVPLRITIEGGTNVSKSPSIEYISHVLLPMLSAKLASSPLQSKYIRESGVLDGVMWVASRSKSRPYRRGASSRLSNSLTEGRWRRCMPCW